jgi:hypothetical protein
MEVLPSWFRSKTPSVRLRVAVYYQIALQTYSLEIIEKSAKSMHSEFFVPGIDDVS